MERSRQPGRGCGGGIAVDAMKLINNLCEGYNAAADEPAMQGLKPLPCPACGSASVQLMTSYSPWFTQAFHVLCIDCQMQGPIACSQREEDAIDIQDLECLAGSTGFEAAAIAAWNTIPRALRWTNEPPKVAGWYFQRTAGEDQTINVAYVYSGLAGLYCKCGCRNTPLKC